jgi:hypothetical protein
MSTKDEIKKEIGRQSSLEAVKLSEGGQLIIKSLKKDISGCLDELSLKYKTSSHTEIIACCAKLSEKIALYRVLEGSSKRKKIAIDDLLAEEKEE